MIALKKIQDSSSVYALTRTPLKPAFPNGMEAGNLLFPEFLTTCQQEVEGYKQELNMLHRLAKKKIMAQKNNPLTSKCIFSELKKYIESGIIRLSTELYQIEKELQLKRINSGVSDRWLFHKYEKICLLFQHFESGLKSRRLNFLESLNASIPISII